MMYCTGWYDVLYRSVECLNDNGFIESHCERGEIILT